MNKQLLTTVEDRIGMIYIDQAEIRQKDFSVVAISENEEFDIPIANILCIMLGPGTSITHRAIEQISQYGCSIIWCGENLNIYYALGQPLTIYSKNILKQISAFSSKMTKIEVIRRMYEIRYPDLKLKSKSAEELIGIEGKHVQNTYIALANKYNINWNGRIYHTGDFDSQDNINKVITSANQLLYAIIQAVLNALGYSTAIGFIHTGKMLSFVYDMSDIYKESIILPEVFSFTSSYKGTNIAKDIKSYVYKVIIKENIVSSIIKNIDTIFKNF